jgi:hypothetical protein
VEGTNILHENDAIHKMENRTHYADLENVSLETFGQLRFFVQSIMNVTRTPPPGAQIQMPEMQLFGMPTDTINAGAVATVPYLKAEDANGELHDILGKYVVVPK